MERIAEAKADLKAAIIAQGVPVPDSTKIDGYAYLVSRISGGGGSELPPGYTRKDWIRGDGNSFINTLVSGNCTWRIVVQAESGQTSRFFIGHSTSIPCFLGILSNGKIGFAANSGQYSNNTSSSAKVDCFVNFRAAGANGAVNNDIVSRTDSATRTEPYYLFTRSSGSNCIIAKLWVADCIKDMALAFHGIPCVRDSDGEVGLYDTVSETFLVNTGTGTFTAGND